MTLSLILAERARHRLEAAAARLRRDEGATTAEYVITTMAAVGFAGLLVVILQSDEVRQILTDMVRNALSVDA